MTLYLDKRAAEIAERVTQLPDDALLSPADLAAYLGIAVGTLKRLRREGLAPPSVQVSPGRFRFRKDAVRAWLNGREESSDSALLDFLSQLDSEDPREEHGWSISLLAEGWCLETCRVPAVSHPTLRVAIRDMMERARFRGTKTLRDALRDR